jgi:hypothetical protein
MNGAATMQMRDTAGCAALFDLAQCGFALESVRGRHLKISCERFK